MEDLQTSFGEFEYKIDEKGRVPLPPKFRRELNEGLTLAPGVEKCITAYPLAEWKKPAVCNFLVRMRSNGFSSERSQLDNKGRRSRSGRF